jgi:hypothetical protein
MGGTLIKNLFLALIAIIIIYGIVIVGKNIFEVVAK